MSGSRYFLVVALCAGVGAVASGLALQQHYHRDSSSFCNINATFNCDVVNRSAYAEVAGIPVALVGLLAYLIMLGVAVFQRKNTETPALVLFLSAAGLAFSFYLTYIEATVLRTWCILCLSSLLAIALIAVFSAVRVRYDLRGSRR